MQHAVAYVLLHHATFLTGGRGLRRGKPVGTTWSPRVARSWGVNGYPYVYSHLNNTQPPRPGAWSQPSFCKFWYVTVSLEGGRCLPESALMHLPSMHGLPAACLLGQPGQKLLLCSGTSCFCTLHGQQTPLVHRSSSSSLIPVSR